MKPTLKVVMGYGLLACILLLGPTLPSVSAQPAGRDRPPPPRMDEERPPEAGLNDPMAGPREGEPRCPGGRRHWRGARGSEGPPPPREGHPRPMRPPGPRDDNAPDFLTEKEREALMAFAKEHFPQIYELLKGAPPEHQHRILRRVGWPLLRLMRLQRHDPELAEKLIAEHKIEMELAQLKRDYQEFPSESARESIKQKMRTLLEQRFDLRQKRLELEIRALEKRLEEARQRLDRQESNRQKLVDAEVERMIDQLQDERMWGPALPSLGAEPEPPGEPLGPPEP